MAAPAAGVNLFVLSLPPLGKPDRRLPRAPLTEPDNRERVLLNGQKGLDCWGAAYKIIALSINAPNTADLPERVVEKARSTRRKAHTEIMVDYRFVLGMDEATIKHYTGIGKDYFDGIVIEKSCFGLDNGGKSMDLRPDIPLFLAQSDDDNFYDYLVHKYQKRLVEVNRVFFQTIGTDLHRAYADFFPRRVPDTSTFPEFWGLPESLVNEHLEKVCGLGDGLVRIKYIRRMHLRA